MAKPTLYKATPIKEGLSFLLQKKKEECVEVEKQVNMLSNVFCEDKNQNILPDNMQFTIFSEFNRVQKMHEKLSDMVKISIDIVAPLKMNEKLAFHNWPHIKRAIRRGVKIRIISQKVDGDLMSRNPRYLSKNPLFELRYLPDTYIAFGLHIFDRQEVTFSLREKPVLGLRTNNANAIKLAEAYFESVWNNAQIN